LIKLGNYFYFPALSASVSVALRRRFSVFGLPSTASERRQMVLIHARHGRD
jgi:hypothetical protein